MTLRVTYLGTAGAVPTVQRNTASVFVNRDGDYLLFDVGEGTQRQMMRYGTGFGVSTVFLTHLHGDHVLGLPGLIQTWGFNDRERPLTVVTPTGTREQVWAFLEALDTEPDFPVSVEEVSPGDVAFQGEDYRIEAMTADHDAPAVGYVLAEEERKGRFDRERAEELGVPVGPKFSRLHEGEPVELEDGTVVEPDEVVGPPRPGRTIVYTGDTRPQDATVDAARGADLLIHDATFASEDADRARETAHSTAREAGEVAARADVDRLALVHISSRYAANPTALAEEAGTVFDGVVTVPDDGQEQSIPYPDDR